MCGETAANGSLGVGRVWADGQRASGKWYTVRLHTSTKHHTTRAAVHGAKVEQEPCFRRRSYSRKAAKLLQCLPGPNLVACSLQDPDFNDPLPTPAAPAAPGAAAAAAGAPSPVVNQEKIGMLVGMGFSAEQATAALLVGDAWWRGGWG